MSSDFHAPAELGQAALAHPPTGLLQIELPHWTAEVRIYGSLLQIIPTGLLHTQEKPPLSGRYATETALSVGVYEVEVILGDRRERQTVAVHPGKTVHIRREVWKDLEFTSAAPLARRAKDRSAHTRNAEKWSRKTTWPSAPGGESRLFLFVHTADPQAYPSFADGLQVLDGNMNLVSDLSKGVQKNVRSGWLAFTADLPAGCYILRRGRRGVRVRQQPIYLCAGWETQVYIEAKSAPSLRTFTINMARRGMGFRSDDETALACEVVLDSLGRSESSRSVMAREQIAVLLEDKLENPWLGILAAYSLRRTLKQTPAGDNQEEIRARYEHVMAFLDIIGDHPDVRALNLSPSKSAGAFWHPPILRYGLKLVQEHATRFADTIPLESLTDIVLDNLVVNSPWTAWRNLDRVPQTADTSPQLASRATKRSSMRKGATALSPVSIYSVQFSGHDFTQAGPFKWLSTVGIAAGGHAKKSEPQPKRTAPMTRDALHEISLVQVTKSLSQGGSLDAKQESVEVNLELTLAELLSRITAPEVSAATGLPLARTEKTLGDLRQASTGEGAQEVLDSPLTATERTILEYALLSANQPGRDTGGAPEPAAAFAPAPEALIPVPSADAADTVVVAPVPPGSIEEYVSRLYAEADRLALASDDNRYATEVRALSERLHQVANRLLQQADFAVRTDLQGRLQQPNAAFLMLLTPRGAATADESLVQEERLAIQRAWEAALAAAPPGRSTMPHPVPHQTFPPWDLQRTAILNERNQVEQAYHYGFRGANSLQPAWDVLRQVKAQLPVLALYSSICAYGVAKSGDDSLQKLESIVFQLEQITAPRTS